MHIIERQVLYKSNKNKKSELIPSSDFFNVVDINGLEPLTLRTSSECSTS